MDVLPASKEWQLTLEIFVFGAGASGWFAYFRLKERGTRQSFRARLAAVVGGYLSVGVAFVLFGATDAMGVGPQWEDLQGDWRSALRSSLCIGLVEEVAKLVPVGLLTWRGRRVERTQEGLFLAACAGLGFAAAESTLLVVQQDFSVVERLARAAAAPLTHALFAAPWGHGLGRLVRLRDRRAMLLGFCISVLAHGLYDLLLAREGAAQRAAPGVVLAIWTWVILSTLPSLAGRRLRLWPQLRVRPV